MLDKSRIKNDNEFWTQSDIAKTKKKVRNSIDCIRPPEEANSIYIISSKTM